MQNFQMNFQEGHGEKSINIMTLRVYKKKSTSGFFKKEIYLHLRALGIVQGRDTTSQVAQYKTFNFTF